MSGNSPLGDSHSLVYSSISIPASLAPRVALVMPKVVLSTALVAVVTPSREYNANQWASYVKNCLGKN